LCAQNLVSDGELILGRQQVVVVFVSQLGGSLAGFSP
jgi:hypothetical protein